LRQTKPAAIWTKALKHLMDWFHQRSWHNLIAMLVEEEPDQGDHGHRGEASDDRGADLQGRER
jgi:hypothetical protein